MSEVPQEEPKKRKKRGRPRKPVPGNMPEKRSYRGTLRHPGLSGDERISLMTVVKYKLLEDESDLDQIASNFIEMCKEKSVLGLNAVKMLAERLDGNIAQVVKITSDQVKTLDQEAILKMLGASEELIAAQMALEAEYRVINPEGEEE